MLETLLPTVAKEVERESNNLADNFTMLIEHLNTKCNPPQPVNEAISAIIMSMQFQDRNTQIMENVTAILERYRTMLEEVYSNIDAMRKGHVASGQDISQAVERILSGIRLSDIRARYLEALRKAQVRHFNDARADAGPEPDSAELF
jgi:hypothetical protein